MKKSILFLCLIGTIVSCSNDDETLENDDFVGSWKLKKIETFWNENYDLNSNEEVIYHFSSDMSLTIESNVEFDVPIGNLTESQTIPYSIYYEEVLYENTVVKLGSNSNPLGVFYFHKNGNSLLLSEYDGRFLTFEKVQ
ncbi:hypothetical protein [Flavobacterium sp. I3-2]|uniref:hypothetical protein n=1 Tax=Flavobacterium sp. I3-2 TaxID=2748319 RepID=UPI0015A7AFD8|nr:hypothetical protein [Flavobacterium sp. I3-2]